MAPDRRFAAMVWGTAGGLLLAGTLHADRSAARGEEVLAFASAPIGWLIEAGGALAQVATFSGPLRPALGGAALAWLAWCVARRRRPGADAVLAALGVGWLGQSFLSSGRVGVGILLYAVGAAAYASRRPAALPRATWPARFEAPVMLGLMGCFVGLRLYRLAVHPEVFFDETAYLSAARMQLGEIPEGPILGGAYRNLYSLERFQAQWIPFFVQALAVRALAPGFLPLRLVSAAAVTAGATLVYLLVRRRLGSAVAVPAFALCAFSPLSIAYSRTGFYIAISMLHAALAFAALVRFRERRDRVSALLLGAVLGCALYLYQLSWFVPVLAAGALWASGREGRDRIAWQGMVLALTLAALLSLPALFGLRGGAGLLFVQTFDKATLGGPPEAPRVQGRWLELLAPAELEGEAAVGLAGSLRAKGLQSSALLDRDGRAVLVLAGAPAELDPVATRLVGEGWLPLADTEARGPWRQVQSLLQRIFYAPGWQQRLRLVDGPLLIPLLAPLAVLGVLAAWRRRREPLVAMLLAWTLAAALLPAAVSGAHPRRTLLMLPFLQVLMALPLAELAAARLPGRAARALRWSGACVLLAAVAASGAELAFRRWDRHFDAQPRVGSKLELVRVLKAQPRDERVFVPRLWPGLDVFLERFEEEPASGARRRVFVTGVAQKGTPELRRLLCRQTAPFVWVAPDTPTHREALRPLETEFGAAVAADGSYRSYRVASVPPEACAGVTAASPAERAP